MIPGYAAHFHLIRVERGKDRVEGIVLGKPLGSLENIRNQARFCSPY